jgi:lipoate-protein ligase B
LLLYTLPLGLTPYDDVWALQKRAAAARISGELPEDLLILVQHPPVVTLGRSTKPGHLLASPEYLEARGIQLRDVERGGDVTIHEPGQLVAYPIVDLKRHKKDLHWYLRQIEEAVIRALATFGLTCHRVNGLTGVWHTRPDGQRVKLASIGVHARDWVTWHGVALNVENDLTTFAHTVPCGIDGVTMSTVVREWAASTSAALNAAPNAAPNSSPSFAQVQHALTQQFAAVFGLQPINVPDSLPILAPTR